MLTIQRVGWASILAAAILTLAAGPASAAAPPNDHNCAGSVESNFVSGPGGPPGSKANPAPGFTDPRDNTSPTWNGPYTSYYAQQPASPGSSQPNGVSEFQQDFRTTNANSGACQP
jgi:hypothetical protein